MELEGENGPVAPHEQNPSPTPNVEPNKGEKKISKKKQKKIDLEELKKELVTVRKPRIDADPKASENVLNPPPFNLLSTSPSHPSSPKSFSPSPGNAKHLHLSLNNSAVFSE